MIDTHGLTMAGIKMAAGATKDINRYEGEYIQISYDRAAGRVMADYHCNLGRNEAQIYHDAKIINVANFDEPTTMQDIADAIAEAVADRLIIRG